MRRDQQDNVAAEAVQRARAQLARQKAQHQADTSWAHAPTNQHGQPLQNLPAGTHRLRWTGTSWTLAHSTGRDGMPACPWHRNPAKCSLQLELDAAYPCRPGRPGTWPPKVPGVYNVRLNFNDQLAVVGVTWEWVSNL